MATGITVTGAGAIAIGIVAGTATGVAGNGAAGMKKGIAIVIPFLLCLRLSTKMAAQLSPRGHFASAKDQNGRQRPAYQRKP